MVLSGAELAKRLPLTASLNLCAPVREFSTKENLHRVVGGEFKGGQGAVMEQVTS